MKLVSGDLDDPRVIALLAHHVTTARAATARGSAHVLEPEGLKSPAIAFWTLWDSNVVVAVGALKRLSDDDGEVKSMHTLQARRRSGAGSIMLRHIIAAARDVGLTTLYLETGSWAYFEPARAFYRTHGFEQCPPFADYVEDPNSVFMRLTLTPHAERQARPRPSR